MKSARRWLSPVLISMVAWIAAGCSQLPTEPSVEPEASLASAEPMEGVLISQTETSVTGRMFGAQGGTLSVGQFRVVVPRGAFPGQATITASQPDLSVPRVDLSIWPASKNHFDVPVVLIADLSMHTPSQVAGSNVRELDPVTGGWMPVSDQSTDVPTMSVSASLGHFSSYRVVVPVVVSAPPPASPPPPPPVRRF